MLHIFQKIHRIIFIHFYTFYYTLCCISSKKRDIFLYVFIHFIIHYVTYLPNKVQRYILCVFIHFNLHLPRLVMLHPSFILTFLFCRPGGFFFQYIKGTSVNIIRNKCFPLIRRMISCQSLDCFLTIE